MNKANIFCYIIVFSFLSINLVFIDKYGMSWDEPFHQTGGMIALTYIGLENVPTEFKSNEKYYGPFFEMINIEFAKWVRIVFGLNWIDSHHVLIVLLSSIGLIFLFKLGKILFGEWIALYSTMFLALYPRFIGHAHYNTKDIPLAVLLLITLFFIYSAFNKKSYYFAGTAGLFFGMSMSIRVDALTILPIIFTSYSFSLFCEWKKSEVIRNTRSCKKEFFMLLIFISSSVISTFLTWPFLWSDPLLIVNSINHFLHHPWNKNVLYLGNIYTAHSVPWHYAPFYLFFVTPMAIVICFLGGLYEILKNFKHKNFTTGYILIFVWFFIPLWIAMLPGLPKYDGIRHYIILLPALALISGVGLNHFIIRIEAILHFHAIHLKSLIMLLVSALLFLEISKVTPYEGSYFNELLRTFKPKQIEDYLELEYWGVSYREGIDWLNNNADYGANICVPIAKHLVKNYKRRSDLNFSCKTEIDYVMLMTRKASYPGEVNSEKFEIIYSVSRFNSNLLHIYKLKAN